MRRRALYLACGSAAILAVMTASFHSFRPRLLYNPSASAPVGFYVLEDKKAFKIGERVAAYPPLWARKLGAERGYLPFDLPVIKRVWAGPGDRICAENGTLAATNQTPIQAKFADSLGREMPVWAGCRALQDGEYLLISNDVQGSFDGRYFGPVQEEQIVGRVRLVWGFGKND